MPRLGWRWLLGLSSLPSLLLLLFYRMTPESPRYLCLKGKTADAANILEKIAKMNGTNQPPGIITSDNQADLRIITTEETSLLSPRKESEPNKGMDANDGWLSTFLMLLSPKLAKSTLLLWIVFFGNAFSYYGLVLLTSEWNSGRSKCKPERLLSEKIHDDVSYRDVFVSSFAGTKIRINYYFLYEMLELQNIVFMKTNTMVCLCDPCRTLFNGIRLLSLKTCTILAHSQTMTKVFVENFKINVFHKLVV